MRTKTKKTINRYIAKKGLVRGYDIGLQNDNLYIPVADRDVISFKPYRGQIEAMLVNGQKIIIDNWNDRIIEEVFEDRQGRGQYKIGYFFFKEVQLFICECCKDKWPEEKREPGTKICRLCANY